MARKVKKKKKPKRSEIKRVLIVHPDCSLRPFRESFLIDGAELSFAVNGVEALRELYRSMGGYDAIICGIIMPQMDGYSFVSRVRTMTDIPVIVLSDNGDLDDQSAQLFAQLGVSCFLPRDSSEEINRSLSHMMLSA